MYFHGQTGRLVQTDLISHVIHMQLDLTSTGISVQNQPAIDHVDHQRIVSFLGGGLIGKSDLSPPRQISIDIAQHHMRSVLGQGQQRVVRHDHGLRRKSQPLLGFGKEAKQNIIQASVGSQAHRTLRRGGHFLLVIVGIDVQRILRHHFRRRRGDEFVGVENRRLFLRLERLLGRGVLRRQREIDSRWRNCICRRECAFR